MSVSDFIYLDHEAVLKYIRNRHPLLMVEDAYVVPGKQAYSERNLDEHEWFFECHFPGNPMVPGVLQLESMFNLAALAIKTLDGNKEKTTNISKVDNVHFKKHIRPGENIRVVVNVDKFRRGLGFMHGIITSANELCCEASFVLVVLDDVIDVAK